MNYFLKSSGFLTLLLLTFSLIGISCEKDDLQDHIVGEWEVKSFKVDGTELKGSIISRSVLEFDEYDKKKGDFDWSISYVDGDSDHESGYYEVDVEDETLVLKSDDGENLEFDLEIEEDELEFWGIVNGQNFNIKAKKED
jgi:hypothetical protein